MKVLKLKHYYCIMGMFDRGPDRPASLFQWLSTQQLHGSESRARSKFLKMMQPLLQTIEEEKRKLAEEHAVKKMVKEGDKKVEKVVFLDENEKDTTDPTKGRNYKLKDKEAWNKEYTDYVNEELIVDITPANSKMIYGVRDVLLNTNHEFKGVAAELYDGWCEAFEDIAEVKKETKVEKKVEVK